MFQSTPPVWRATHSFKLKNNWLLVSIHAPRVEGDVSWNQ